MKTKLNKILVMHTGGWIGDMVLLTPALRELRRRFPESHISMLIRPLVNELMKRNPYVDGVIVHNPHKGFRQFLDIVRSLSAQKFDAVFILHPNSISSGFIAYFAGIPERIASDLKIRNILITRKIENSPRVHEVQRYLNTVSYDPTLHNEKLEFWGIREEDRAFAKEFIAQLDPSKPIIGINISTTWQSKQWSGFPDLINTIMKESNVIITGRPEDISSYGVIEKISGGSIINLTGKTTLFQLGAIIERCDVYVTCDSGPMHISAAIDISTVALFGPTDSVRHGPYGEGHIVIKKAVLKGRGKHDIWIAKQGCHIVSSRTKS